jgi:hypothetical protein
MEQISVIDWCIEYNRSFAQLEQDRAAFDSAYTNQVHVEIPRQRYREALEWLTQRMGTEDEHSITSHEFRSRWCRFHPMTDDLHMEEGQFTSSVFGFKNARDAMLFKLSWWN